MGQTQFLAQILSNLIDLDMDIQQPLRRRGGNLGSITGMQNREIDFRVECDNFFRFGKGRSGYLVVHIAAVAVFDKAGLRLTGIADQVLVRCKKIMHVQLGHDAQREKQEQRAGNKTSYDRESSQVQNL